MKPECAVHSASIRKPLSGSRELHRGNVDERHVGSEFRTIEREAARPAPGIEHVHSRADVLRDEVAMNRVFDAALERRLQTKPFLLREIIEVPSYAFCIVGHGSIVRQALSVSGPSTFSSRQLLVATSTAQRWLSGESIVIAPRGVHQRVSCPASGAAMSSRARPRKKVHLLAKWQSSSVA